MATLNKIFRGMQNGAETIDQNFSTLLNLLHPVGSYYISNDATDPKVLFGFGTWQRANGRVIVGVDENDPALSSPNKTGGSINPLTEHGHSYAQGATGAIGTGASGAENQVAATKTGGYWGNAASVAIASAGNNTNHANWQPFLTAYIWHRTA
jgi:hypothetical protein